MKVWMQYTGGLDAALYTANGHEVTDNIEEADLAHFDGGPDVDPSLYGQGVHATTSYNSARDEADKLSFISALRHGVPMVGVCRGGQFLNVMCGGEMYQDVDNHTASHQMIDVRNGLMFEVTSTHHQMMKPSLSGQVLGVASESTLYSYMYKDWPCVYRPVRGEDIEVVWYKNNNCLCYQPHPEYMEKGSKCQENFFSLIKEYSLCAD